MKHPLPRSQNVCDRILLAFGLSLLVPSCAPLRHRPEWVGPPRELGWSAIWHDLGHAPKALWADTRATFTDRTNLYILGGLGGLAIVAESFEEEERRIGKDLAVLGDTTSESLQMTGDGGVLLAASLGLTTFGALAQNELHYESGKLATEALVVTGLTTLAIKVVVPDQRPNGSSGDFPSGHSSMSMAAATAIDAAYGPWFGYPAYAVALLVGVQRIDSDHHDLSAVLFGWTLGFLTTRSIVGRKNEALGGARLSPTIDPERQAVGLSLSWSF